MVLETVCVSRRCQLEPRLPAAFSARHENVRRTRTRESRVSLLYDRPDEGFAYITRGSSHVMLEQCGVGRNWLTDELEPPFGRGINFQIGVPDLAPILSALADAKWPLFMEPETKWYRVSNSEKAGDRVSIG